MTHSHDRTLLARLGFQDPDLKEPVHDLACEYVSLEENALKLRELAAPATLDPNGEHYNERYSGTFNRCVTESKFSVTSHIECAISKGIDPRYKTTIGFLDVKIDWTSQFRAVGTFTKNVYSKTERKYVKSIDPVQVDDWLSGPEGTVAVEVKIHPIGVGELVRQINLYREYAPTAYTYGSYRRVDFVACVAFDVDEYYRDALIREHVALVKLGDKFHAWGADRFSTNKAKPTEL